MNRNQKQPRPTGGCATRKKQGRGIPHPALPMRQSGLGGRRRRAGEQEKEQPKKNIPTRRDGTKQMTSRKADGGGNDSLTLTLSLGEKGFQENNRL